MDVPACVGVFVPCRTTEEDEGRVWELEAALMSTMWTTEQKGTGSTVC